MSEQEQYSKTEEPTPRRLEKAREEGDVAYSQELMIAASMAVATTVFWLAGESIADQLQTGVRYQLKNLPSDWSLIESARLMLIYMWQGAVVLGLMLLSLVVVAILFGGGQTGFRITFEPLNIKWERLNPVQGFSRLFSSQSLVKGLLAVVKISALGVIIYWIVSSRMPLIENAGRLTVDAAIDVAWQTILRMMAAITLALFVTGVADYFFQRWRLMQKLRMTKQEVRDEKREEEGDPQIRAKIKQMRVDRVKATMLREVPTATVVLTNPTHIAIALRYDRHSGGAPTVVAKATGALAKRIVRIAEEHDIPVLERKPIARMLYKTTEIGQEIPVELYHAIAEIVAYLYRIGRVA